MRHWAEVDCHNALDCFSGGRCGKGAYDHEESSEAGGRPYGRCFCMTEQEHAEAEQEEAGFAESIQQIYSDLSAAQQPLGAEFETVWDAAEGELYEE